MPPFPPPLETSEAFAAPEDLRDAVRFPRRHLGRVKDSGRVPEVNEAEQEARILDILRGSPGGVSLMELSQEAGRSRNLYGTVRGLLARGLVGKCGGRYFIRQSR